MRLLDQVASANKPILIERPSGEVIRLTGAGSRAEFLVATPLRYVLDESASAQCAEFMRLNEGMFDPVNELLRVFADQFWLEWSQPAGSPPAAPAAPAAPARAGILVEASAKGRKGVVQSFWEVPGAEPDMAQASIEFDFDQPIAELANQRDTFTLSAASAGPIARLVRHLLIRVHPEWLPELSRAGAGPFRQAVGQIALAIWRDLLFALAFSAVLSSGGRVEPAVVSRAKLNEQRVKRGKPALLDHTEVTLRLGVRSEEYLPRTSGAVTGPRRLHYVRGHMVHREGKVFWRTSHLRGDKGASPLIRTVSVKGF